VQGRESHAVTGLSNSMDYEFFVALEELDDIRSHKITETPRSRNDCFAVFCSQQDLASYLQTLEVNPLSLKCHGEYIDTWDANSPNCLYSNVDGSLQFLLNRYMDTTFNPPPDRSLELITKIATQTLWPITNPFENPEDFPTKVTMMEEPFIGNITEFSEARSFEIRYHQELSSRVT
jgi:hypothetical protein